MFVSNEAENSIEKLASQIASATQNLYITASYDTPDNTDKSFNTPDNTDKNLSTPDKGDKTFTAEPESPTEDSFINEVIFCYHFTRYVNKLCNIVQFYLVKQS